MAVSLIDIKDVLALASSVLKLGENHYNASLALEEFEGKVRKLESTYKSWERRAQECGVSSHGIFQSSLSVAKKQLEREEDWLKHLDRGCGCLGWWCLSWGGTNIPKMLGESIGNLDDEISANLKAANDAEDTTWKVAEFEACRSTNLPFGRDRRYVKLPNMEKRLKSLLNNEDSGYETAFVVLLYGRAGSGKSSIARNLALDYKQAATSYTDAQPSDSGNGCRAFFDVLYVQCGRAVGLVEKQKELLGMLHPKKSAESDTKEQTDPTYIKQMLTQLLKERRSLIIFDDVWEREFLEDMVGVCGRHVRVLVTSQTTDPCDRTAFDTELVPMNTDTGDSLRILKVHSGFHDEDAVAENVKKLMDRVMVKVGGHPHALASLAVTINAKHRTDVQEWENVIREYDRHLDDGVDIDDHKKSSLHGVHYEHSFMKAIQIKFGRLSETERKLMVFMAILAGPSVPEVVVQLLHAEILVQKKIKDVRLYSSFLHARGVLENLQCIKTREYFGIQTWSLHSLDEQYILRWMKHDVDLVLRKVKQLPDKKQGLEAGVQVHATKILGNLFFKSEYVDYETLSRLEISRKSRQISAPSIAISRFFGSLVRSDIIPIIGCMARNVGEDWNTTLQNSSDQIFLSYAVDAVMHKNASKNLFSSSTSKHQIWTLIRRRWWPMTVDEDLVIGVLGVFGDPGTVPLNLEQCEALLDLVRWDPLQASCVSQIRKLVFGLVEMLTSPSCPRNTKDLSATVLGYLLVPLMSNTSFDYGHVVVTKTLMIIERIYGVEEYSDFPIRRHAQLALEILCDSNSDLYKEIVRVGLQVLGSLKEEGDFLSIVATLNDLVVERFGWSWNYKCSQILGASLIQDLSDLLEKKISTQDQHSDVVALLTWINPARGESFILCTFEALHQRGSLLVKLGQYESGVSDLVESRKLDFEQFAKLDAQEILIGARVRLKDWEGALEDFHYWEESIKKWDNYPDSWKMFHRERGILKRMKGDLVGALKDLDRALQVSPEDLSSEDFESLKHRGYVEFLLGDEEGARADAQRAVQFQRDYDYQERVDSYLGTFIVEFLGFRL